MKPSESRVGPVGEELEPDRALVAGRLERGDERVEVEVAAAGRAAAGAVRELDVADQRHEAPPTSRTGSLPAQAAW